MCRKCVIVCTISAGEFHFEKFIYGVTQNGAYHCHQNFQVYISYIITLLFCLHQ
jgi:hypothetical protein